MQQEIERIQKLAKIPMKTESEMQMDEIVVLKYKAPEVEVERIKRIIENTNWPFKLTVYDN